MATIAATSPPLPGMSLSKCLSSRESHLRLQSLSGIAARRAAWERFLLKYTCQAYPSGVWRALQRPSGAAKSLPLTISELNKKAYVHIEDWHNAFCKAGGIRMSTLMTSTYAAMWAESLKMWPFWRRLQ